MSIRHTVGGAQSVVTPWRTSARRAGRGVEARRSCRGRRVASAFHGREEAAPRVLGPARRGDVEVHVAGLQPDPVHRRQVADRVALVRVQRRASAARSCPDVKYRSSGSVGPRRAVRGERRPARRRRRRTRASPATASPTAIRVQAPATPANSRRRPRRGDDVPHVAAVDPVPQVVGGEQRSRPGSRRRRASSRRASISQSAHLVAEHHAARGRRAATPRSRRQLATRFERAASSAKERVSAPSSSTIHSAGRVVAGRARRRSSRAPS